MVKWSNTWLEKFDKNNIKIKLWTEYKSTTHAFCRLCNSELKFDQQWFQVLYQNSGKPKHENISKLALGNNHSRTASKTASSGSQKCLLLDQTYQDRVSSAETIWFFKVAEEDMALRDCDNVPVLFQKMFPDSQIAKEFTISKNKASFILQDGLRPLLAKW